MAGKRRDLNFAFSTGPATSGQSAMSSHLNDHTFVRSRYFWRLSGGIRKPRHEQSVGLMLP
jgi:hypothetical protein